MSSASAAVAEREVVDQASEENQILQIPDLGTGDSADSAVAAGDQAPTDQAPADGTSTSVEEQTAATEDPTVIDASFTVTPDAPVAAVVAPAEPQVSPAEQMDLDIAELQRDVANQACEVARREASLKSAKKEFNTLVAELRDLEARRDAGDFGLPFSKAAAGSTGDDSGVQAKHVPLEGQQSIDFAGEKTTEAEDDSWRSAPLSSLDGLSGKLLETLAEAGLTTMGQLADFTKSDKRLIDLAGIGPGKATKIEEACTGFWERWSTRMPAETVAAAAPVVDGQVQAQVQGEASEPGVTTEEQETAAYKAGCEACLASQPTAANPHAAGTILHSAWDRGWQETNAS